MGNHCARLPVLTLSLFCLFSSLAFAQGPQAYSWSVTPPNVASVLWTNQQIADFLNAVTQAVVKARVGDFQFVDLDGDGQLELVATVDFSGRSLFNTLAVVRRVATAFAVQQLDTLAVQTLDGVVRDVDGDGKPELFIAKPLTPYLGGGKPQAQWQAIYRLTDSVLIDVSSQFAAYYQSSILPVLKARLERLLRAAPGSIDAAIAHIEYDKIMRVSGQEPDAGEQQALVWATSADPTYVIFAAAILADIGTRDALKTLQVLATAQNPDVAMYAAAELQTVPHLHFTAVRIVIQPSSENRSIYLQSGGSISVAILSTPTLYAPAVVDTRSLTFGSTGAEDSLLSCERQERDDGKGHDQKSRDGNEDGRDVNHDGIVDLVCRFDVQASSFQRGDGTATLRGKLRDGTTIKGTAAVVIVPSPRNDQEGSDDHD